MVPILIAGGFSSSTAAWLSPLFFGVAHLHHLYQHVLIDRAPILTGVIQVVFQFAYTSIFGWYGAFLLVRNSTGILFPSLLGFKLATSNFCFSLAVLAPIVAHSFCNSMGFPDVGEINSYSSKKCNIFISCVYLLKIYPLAYF